MPRGERGRGGSSRGRGKPRVFRGKCVSSIEEVMARNQDVVPTSSEEEDELDSLKARKSARPFDMVKQSGESDSDSDEEIVVGDMVLPGKNTNRNRKPVEKEGIVKLSRREREELERVKQERIMERLQAEGKTSKAKADLARLAEIRKMREAAMSTGA